MKQCILLICCFILVNNLNSQSYAEGCDGKRYASAVFPQYTVSSSVYARPTPENFDLWMDIYEPNGDQVSKRPLILFVHGGGFFSGSRADMQPFCVEYVKKGFVTASIDYRLFLGIPDEAGFIKAVIKAISDFKASYRFFKEDAVGANKYKIDTTKMFIGGYSAGAITVLHAAYLDQNDRLSPAVWAEIQSQGGLKGNTGSTQNLAHKDSDIFGVFNFAGAVYDKSMFDAGEPMLMSYHGDKDQTVPIDSAIIFTSTVYGSRTIQNAMNNVGNPNIIEIAPGAGHTEIFTDPKYLPNLYAFIDKATALYYPRLCGFPAATSRIDQDISNTISPNPGNNIIQFVFNTDIDQLLIYSPSGQIVSSYEVNSNHFTLERFDLKEGIYFAIPMIKGIKYKPLRFAWQ